MSIVLLFCLLVNSWGAENISTINKPGEDYNTLTLWEDAKNADITAGNAEVAECYDDDGTLTDWLVINGWTTDSDSYIKVYAPAGERHSGYEGTGFRWVNSTSFRQTCQINEEFVRLEALEIEQTITNRDIIFTNYAEGQDGEIWVSHCIIQGAGASIGINHYPTGGGTSLVGKFWNNKIYNVALGFSIRGDVANVYSNSISTVSSIGFRRLVGTAYLKNNVSMDFGGANDYTGTWTNAVNNASEDGTAPGSNTQTVTSSDWDSTVESNSGFLVPADGGNLQDTGTSLSSDSDGLQFSDDITFTVRSGTWDIGAHESIVAVPPVTGVARPVIIITGD